MKAAIHSIAKQSPPLWRLYLLDVIHLTSMLDFLYGVCYNPIVERKKGRVRANGLGVRPLDAEWSDYIYLCRKHLRVTSGAATEAGI